MKFKFLTAVASALIVSSSFLFTVIPPSYADDKENEEASIIVNDNFDDGNAGNWVTFGGGTLNVADTVAHSGTNSITVSDRKETYQGPSLHCDSLLVAGEKYELSGWVYHQGDATATISWTARFIDANGETTYAQINGAEVQPNEWTELSNSLIIPENAVNYLVYFECSDVEGEFFVDDVTIKGKKNDGTQSTTSEPDYQSEYIYDFESDVENWGQRGDVKIIHTDEYSSTGSHSIYITNRTAVWNGPTLMITDKTRKEESYHYSVDVMYNGSEYDNSHVMRLEMQYTLNDADTYNLIASKEVKKGKWTTIEGYYTIPADAKNISIYVQTDNLEEGQEITESDLLSFYIDNVKITEGAIVRKARAIKTAIILAVSAISAIIIILIRTKFAKRIKKSKTKMKLVSFDAMTKVFNRNSYEKKIKELENDIEQCKSLYYALCDVNFLKYINDNFGHESGDEAITRCAKMLSEAGGNDCKVYRTGGDEFVCISKTPIKDKIKNAIKTESGKDKGYPFAVACGFAEYDEKECADIKSIIAKCDKEMYADKQKIKSENQEFSRK